MSISTCFYFAFLNFFVGHNEGTWLVLELIRVPRCEPCPFSVYASHKL